MSELLCRQQQKQTMRVMVETSVILGQPWASSTSGRLQFTDYRQFSFQSTGYAGANTLSCIRPYFQPWSSEPRSRCAGEFPSLQTGRKRRLHGVYDKNAALVSSTMAFRQAQDRAHNITLELIINGKLALTQGHICLLQVNHFLPA